MSEPTVRLDGLLPLTRRRYGWQLAAGYFLAGGILRGCGRWPELRQNSRGCMARGAGG